jgi:enamine deaminase RidA (YjgF/YER057c/UK114 family)
MRADVISPVRLALLLTALPLSGCAMGGRPQPGAGAGPMVSEAGGADLVDRQYINPDSLLEANGFSHAVRHGRLLYITGELPLDREGNLVGRGDRRAQLEAVFRNLRTLLKAARSSPGDMLRVTVYLVNPTPSDWDLLRQTAPDFFPTRNAPAVTLLGVQSLSKEGALVAVDGTAVMTGLLQPLDRPAGVRRRG